MLSAGWGDDRCEVGNAGEMAAVPSGGWEGGNACGAAVVDGVNALWRGAEEDEVSGRGGVEVRFL